MPTVTRCASLLIRPVARCREHVGRAAARWSSPRCRRRRGCPRAVGERARPPPRRSGERRACPRAFITGSTRSGRRSPRRRACGPRSRRTRACVQRLARALVELARRGRTPRTTVTSVWQSSASSSTATSTPDRRRRSRTRPHPASRPPAATERRRRHDPEHDLAVLLEREQRRPRPGAAHVDFVPSIGSMIQRRRALAGDAELLAQHPVARPRGSSASRGAALRPRGRLRSPACCRAWSERRDHGRGSARIVIASAASASDPRVRGRRRGRGRTGDGRRPTGAGRRTSITVAEPMPPPAHMLATPMPPPRRRSS